MTWRAINRLYQHLAETDPERFVVAVDDALGTIAGFASAVVRGRLWFLSMCFVRPDRQAGGIGRALVEAILPPAGSDMVLATATDSAQPISNALYSGFGIVPRMPLFSISGYVTEPESLPGLPAGVVAVPFESVVAERPGGSGHAELGEAVGALDRELLGVEHPQDHRFLRIGGRHGFLYRDSNGANLGYGYAAESGRIGPLAVGDPALLGPALGQLLRAVPFRGAQAVWVPGLAGPAVTMLLRGRPALRGLPDPDRLELAVRRLRTLPADLARVAIGGSCYGQVRSGVVASRRGFPERGPSPSRRAFAS